MHIEGNEPCFIHTINMAVITALCFYSYAPELVPIIDLRNKTYVPVFYRGNKIWVRVRVCMI